MIYVYSIPSYWPIPAYDSSLFDTTRSGGKHAMHGTYNLNNTQASNPIQMINADNVVFSVYPNPASGNFTISAGMDGVFAISDIEGQQVASYTIHAGKTLMQIETKLAPGIYVGRYKAANGSMKMIRIVKE